MNREELPGSSLRGVSPLDISEYRSGYGKIYENDASFPLRVNEWLQDSDDKRGGEGVTDT